MEYSKFANNYLGTREGTARHNYIINYYNDHIRPLPRNYKVKLTDSWCATFVSFVLKKCNAKNAPFECSANLMRKKAIQNKQYRRGSPRVNDIVFYCWNGSGIAQHVGIVKTVKSTTIEVIEGNKDDIVGIRRISKTSNHILGYATIPQHKENNSKYTQVVKDVINGKYGNGKDREKKLKENGYNPDQVQELVNKALNK